jgi:hypothetical protein
MIEIFTDRTTERQSALYLPDNIQSSFGPAAVLYEMR